MKNIMVFLVLVFGFNAGVFAQGCKEIKIINGSAKTTITIEGIRGSLSIPAIIDTGANISVIPQSIAEGIGYNYHKIKKFSAVGASHKLKVIKVKKISILGMDFKNVKVAIEPKHGKYETALIGMSELSKTDISIKNGVFKICGKDIVNSKINKNAYVTKKDRRIAEINEYERTCELDDVSGCFNLGMEYWYDFIGVKQNYFKAVEYFQKACKLDSGGGCYKIGYAYHKGQGVKQDYSKATEYYQKACGLDDGDGCLRVGWMYEYGQGVKQDSFKAVKYHQKACGLYIGNSCFSIGYAYEKGKGVKQDDFKAVEFYQKACNLNDGSGCSNLAKYLQNTCELNDGSDCNNLGILYIKGGTNCGLDSDNACHTIATIFRPNNDKGVKQDYFKAEKYFQKACRLDSDGGCYGLGVMYNKGLGVKQSYFKAVEYFQKACGLDNGGGCYGLGVMYGNGLGVRQSNQKALEYYGKACDSKNQLGCKNYAKLKDL